MFVLSMVLVMISIIGVGCKDNSPKKGDPVVIDDRTLDEVFWRGVTTGNIRTDGSIAFIEVQNPGDNIMYPFKMRVVASAPTGPAAIHFAKNHRFNVGSEIIFRRSIIFSEYGPLGGGAIQNCEIGVFYSFSSDHRTEKIANPPIKK